MSNILVGSRQSGKTTKLIMESAATGSIIVTPTAAMRTHIRCMANEMGLVIPDPISLNTFLKRIEYGSQGRYLVDELQMILHDLHVDLATADVASVTPIDSKNDQHEVPHEAKSLRWLANMFPFVENPTDEGDKMCNCIHIYCESGAKRIETMQEEIDRLKVFEEFCINQKEVVDRK